MFLSRCKNLLRTALAFVFLLSSCFLIKLSNVSRLSFISGKRTYFLLSSSSQGVQKTSIGIFDLQGVKGESVVFEIKTDTGGRYATNIEIYDNVVRKILDKYRAEVRFVEEVADTTSYYCYTTLWKDALYLKGEYINLHIAVNNECCSVGTPIIFGGF